MNDMAKLLSSIDLTWDSIGRINLKIQNGYDKPSDNIRPILAPSIPMLIQHQLGVMKPAYGLVACSRLIDYFLTGKYNLLPINDALKTASIQFVKLTNSVTLRFFPKSRLFSNSDSIEQGVHHLINNYVPFIYHQLGSDTALVVKAMCGSTISEYLEFIEKEILPQAIISNQLKWLPKISQYMSSQLGDMAAFYGPDLPEEADREEISTNIFKRFNDLKHLTYRINSKLGLV